MDRQSTQTDLWKHLVVDTYQSLASSHHQVCTIKAVDTQKLTSSIAIQAGFKADSEYEWDNKGENSRQIK